MTLPTLQLPGRLADAIAAGHPWVYRDHLPRRPSVADGSWVRVEAGRAAAVGLWAAEGPIAVRLFRRAPDGGPLATPDDAWVDAMVARALAQRAPIEAAGSDAYRLVYGEGDGLPGITVDRYGRFAVVSTYAEAYRRAGSDAARLLERVARTLSAVLRLKGVAVAPRDDAPLTVLRGAPPPPEITVREHGLAFLANLYEGQKTGLFLDQRENRATVRASARHRRVANLFAYNGAFSVYALAGGALRAVDVDLSAAALRDAERNVAANLAELGAGDRGAEDRGAEDRGAEDRGTGDSGTGDRGSGDRGTGDRGTADRHAALASRPADATPLERHATLALDLLDDPAAALRHPQLADSDLIVLDPPSLARRKGQRHAALRAYRRLNAAAMAALPAGGLLATASCTAQVSPEAFRGVLAEAALEAGVDARVLHEAGHAADHPVPLAFPEGRYLKFLLLRVDRPR